MSATIAVRHPVADFAAWHVVYNELEPLRLQHGCTAKKVMRAPDNANDVFILHDFPTVAQAEAFTNDPALKAGMEKAGVAGPPRIEIFESI